MILLIHIIIALSSIVLTTIYGIAPSKTKARISYGLVGLTLVTGTYLVVRTHSPLLSSCMTGLAYLVVAFAGIGVGAYRMRSVKQTERD